MWTIHHCPNSFSTHVLNVWTAIHQRLGSSGIIQPQKVQKFFPGVERTSRLAPARGQALQWNYPSSGIHKSLQTLPFASWKCRMHFNTLGWVVHQLGISTKTGDSNILISPSWMIQPFETLGLASPRLWSSPPVSMTLRHQGDARVMPLAIPVPISLTLTHIRQWT